MLGQYEAEQHHLLTTIELAQRAGRSEREITEIVDRYFGESASGDVRLAQRREGRLRRLLDRATHRRAA